MADFQLSLSSKNIASNLSNRPSTGEEVNVDRVNRYRSEGLIPGSLYEKATPTSTRYKYDPLAADWIAIALEINRRFDIPLSDIAQMISSANLPSTRDQMSALVDNLIKIVEEVETHSDLVERLEQLSMSLSIPPGKPPTKPPKPPRKIR
jgi:hypothetical protein